jgi:ADP-heptose:LPS heptosyltransferase
MNNNRQHKILIYRLGSLGDTVMALPCFHRVRECFPDADITLLTNKPVMSKAAPLQAVLGDAYFFNRTLTYPVGTRNPILLAKLAASIRALKIDTVINITALRSMSADRRDKLFFTAAGVKNFYGFDQTKEDFQLSIDPETGHYEWEAIRLARKIEKLGTFSLSDSKYWDLKFTDDELARSELHLKEMKHPEKIIALNAGTKMPVKDWGESNWVALVKRMNHAYKDFSMVVLGVKEETDRAEVLLGHWKGDGKNLCGQTSPRVSAAILQRSKVFIGHDSGPMHLAACVGTPCVAVFSLINKPRQWFPRGENNVILFPEEPPETFAPEFPSDPEAKSILTIAPETVFRALDDVLNKMELL